MTGNTETFLCPQDTHQVLLLGKTGGGVKDTSPDLWTRVLRDLSDWFPLPGETGCAD